MTATARATLRVGTSGWQYAHWRGRLYPRRLAVARLLEHYAARFATVEVNNTFYRLPRAATFAAWRERVPPDFCFAIKASAYLTHRKRLRDPAEPVARLLERAAPLRPRLGAVLLQLPPNLPCAPGDLDATLRAFSRRVRVAVEVRHRSWFCAEVEQILAAHGAALCLVDRGSRVVTPEWRTAGWAYVRMHGGRGRPASGYGARALGRWAARLRDLYGPDADGYVYFNNDAHGCAPRDAAAFAAAVARAGLAPTRVPARREVPAGP